MEIEFTPKALSDLNYWSKKGNKKILERITKILVSIQKSPFKGLGKPEPLKHNFRGS